MMGGEALFVNFSDGRERSVWPLSFFEIQIYSFSWIF
jgi:hypothetical protein